MKFNDYYNRFICKLSLFRPNANGAKIIRKENRRYNIAEADDMNCSLAGLLCFYARQHVVHLT